MQIKTSKIDGVPDESWHEVLKVVQTASATSDDKSTLAELALSGAGGLATNQGWEAFKATNTFTRDDYVSKLTEYGLAQDSASDTANQIIDAVDSGWAKPFLVGVSAAGGTYALLEAISATSDSSVAGWSRVKKVWVSVLVGGSVAGLYWVLRYFEVVT